jgi:hypothetical protein
MNKRAYDFVLELFNFTDLDSIIHRDIPLSSMKGGIMNTVSGILIAVLTLLAFALLSVVYLGMVFDSLPVSSTVAGVRPSLSPSLMIGSVVFFGILTPIALFLWIFAHQLIIFALTRLFRGSGSFSAQYFVTSFITLALGTMSLGFIPMFILSVFLPCFNLFFVLFFIAVAVYLMIYVQAKMLVAVHKISFASAFGITMISTIGFVIIYALLQFILLKIGFGPDFATELSFFSGSSDGVQNLANITNISTVRILNNTPINP